MKAGIITIGDELLIGQTINSNIARIGKALTNIGIKVIQSTTIQDDKQAIVNALDLFMHEFDLVIISGGLGPTKDDITKETLTAYFKTELELNKEVLKHVESFFTKKGKEMLSSNIHQAMLPKKATVLENKLGTAPGMWFTKEEKIVISLPGVPYELEGLLANQVIPKLSSMGLTTEIYHETIMTIGIGESFLAEKIKDWENRLYQDKLKLAYLPSPGLVKLRITSYNGEKDKIKIKAYIDDIKKLIPEYLYSDCEESIFETVGNLLRKRNQTIGTIESCTGGRIANSFVEIPGASDYLVGGLVTYSNKMKMNLAHVSLASLNEFGAVSEEVAKEMALGGKKQLGCDYTIAVTGIAGPDGGSIEKPVGTVWVAVAHPNGISTKKFQLNGNRERNIEVTTLYAVNLLRKMILGINP
ncbi:MAG: competence/damage-inducible protein A [Brumimicrobium sp.]|nr:competence/damage-inducible protein A [Brumimicrobium sp.]